MKRFIISVFVVLSLFAFSFMNTKSLVHQLNNERAVLKDFFSITLAYADEDCTEEVFKDNCDPTLEHFVCTVDVGGKTCKFSFAKIRQQ